MKKPRCMVEALMPPEPFTRKEVKEALRKAWAQGFADRMDQTEQVLDIKIDLGPTIKELNKEADQLIRRVKRDIAKRRK